MFGTIAPAPLGRAYREGVVLVDKFYFGGKDWVGVDLFIGTSPHQQSRGYEMRADM